MKLPEFYSIGLGPILLKSHHNLAQVGSKLIVDAPEAHRASHIRELDQGLLYRLMEHSFL